LSTAADRASTARREPIRLLQAAAFVATFDRFAMPPMIVAIARDLESPLATVVQAAGAYFLVYGLSQPLWGIVSDRLGRVRTMRLTLALAGAAAMASAAADSPLQLAVARGLTGGLFGAAYPASLIYIGDTVPVEVRQRDVARLMVGVALGTALASVGAGVMAELASWRWMFLLTGAAALVLAVALGRLPEPRREVGGGSALARIGRVARSPMAVFVLLCACAEGAVLLGTITLMPPAVESAGASVAVAGVVTGAYGLGVFLFSGLVGRLSQRWHPSRLILLGATAAVLACSVLAWSQQVVAGTLAALLLALAWTAMHSSLQTWATEVLPEARATVVSFFAGSLFVGSSLAAVLASNLAGSGHFSAIFALGAVLTVPLGLGAATVRARWRRPGDARARA
jgi:predicted MFS family arabinose efflux permease